MSGSNGVAGTKPYANGFAALKSLDSDADNQFTSTDAAWNNLRVWVDANHDGKTDAGELKTLTSLGITSISLANPAGSTVISSASGIIATTESIATGAGNTEATASFVSKNTSAR